MVGPARKVIEMQQPHEPSPTQENQAQSMSPSVPSPTVLCSDTKKINLEKQRKMVFKHKPPTCVLQLFASALSVVYHKCHCYEIKDRNKRKSKFSLQMSVLYSRCFLVVRFFNVKYTITGDKNVYYAWRQNDRYAFENTLHIYANINFRIL